MFNINVTGVIATLTAALAAAGASAQMSYFNEYEQGPWTVLEVEGVEPCGDPALGLDFPIQISLFEKFKEKQVGDRLIMKFQGHLLYNNPANGRQSREDWNSQVIFDFGTGMIYNPGTPIRLTGEDGRVAIAAGRLVLDMNTWELARPYTGIQWPEAIAYPDPEGDYQRLLCEDLAD